MKKIFLLCMICFLTLAAQTQNVGIGTTAPLTKLHIANGASGATPFVFSRLAVESNGDTYINLLSPAVNETAILFGQPGSAANGVIMYNTSGTSNGFQFRNNGNQTRMVIDSAGNVGIGTTTPAFPLSFGTALGDKISLWSNSTNSYGFGIQGGLLQIHTDISAADIAFGYGSSAAFTEKMRIKGDGNVGIGITNPTASLEVMRGTGAGGTAVFRGTTNMSRFNFGTDEDTYIRAGKDNGYVIINDIPGGRVGIGTSTPLQKLHVEGTVYLNGNVGIGTATPSQKLHVVGTIYLNGNVGIGESSPSFPLSFSSAIGDKISLWSNSTNSYGFGIRSGLLQIHTDVSSADIAFGYGSSNAFTETMRIKGDGNVGIGNNNPAYQLDISNRMRIRSGGNNTVSAGLWFNNNANTEAAFIGMEDDTHVGLFGNGGAGWKFGMNTQTGALKINGTEGTAGQVLQTNGSSTPASWVSSTNSLYNNTVVVTGTSTIILSSGIPETLLPGMSYTFNLVTNAKVLMSFNVPIWNMLCFACTASHASLRLKFDGVYVNVLDWDIGNDVEFHLTGSQLISTTPGTHTIQISAVVFGVNISFGDTVFPSNMIIQVIPQ
jgi:hypothetical protein